MFQNADIKNEVYYFLGVLDMGWEELKALIKDIGIFDFYDWLQNPENEEKFNGVDEEELLGSFLDEIFSSIDEVILNPKLLGREYSGMLDLIIEQGDINVTVKLLKIDMDIDKILRANTFNYSLSDIEQLEDTDREIFIEKLGDYLPIDIQEQLMPGKKREELIAGKREAISKLSELHNEEGAFSQINGMEEDEILEIVKSLNGDSIVRFSKELSEEKAK